jgi:hypothetical protein
VITNLLNISLCKGSVFGNWTKNQCWVGTQFQLVKSELELGLIIGTRFVTGTVFSVF